jgi:hypothetical protein
MPLVTLDTLSTYSEFLFSAVGPTSGTENAVGECASFNKMMAWRDTVLPGNGTNRDLLARIDEHGAGEGFYLGLAMLVCIPELDATLDSQLRYAFAVTSVSGKPLQKPPAASGFAAGYAPRITPTGSRVAAALLLATFGDTLPCDIHALCMPEQPETIAMFRDTFPSWARHFEV